MKGFRQLFVYVDFRVINSKYTVIPRISKSQWKILKIHFFGIVLLHKCLSRIYIGIIAHSTCSVQLYRRKGQILNHIIKKSELPRGNPKLYGYSILIPLSIIPAPYSLLPSTTELYSSVPSTQKIFRRPVYTLSVHFWDTQYRNVFFSSCFNKKTF